MTLAKLLPRAVMSGTNEERVKELCKFLNYPFNQLDPQGSRFYYLHPGVDESEARETCPIAVGFYSELNDATDGDIRKFLTAGEPQPEIYKHYTSRTSEDQPVMYLLLPAKEGAGRVPLVLPNEGGLKSRQIQTFDWNEPELLARLSRLQQGALPIASRALCSVPLVEWVFYEPIKTAGELARSLAKVARQIEQAIPKVYAAEKKDGYLHKLLESFQRELLPTLQLTSDNEKDYSFADIYAQTIAYGLFTARVFSYVKDEREGKAKETDFNRQDAWKQLPETNPFLRKLFRDVSEQTPQELGDELMEAISEIFSILRAAKMDAILSDFRQKMNREDIVIRFYEDFLAAYKPQMRERRGVYYTPEPVVSYMVRSVDEMLKDKFSKPLGLADPEVMILDPACGTGTFLLWICQLIHGRFQESPEALTEGLADKSWSSYVKERLLPRIFGFELLMAPYAIAHLKLGLFLEETGYQFDSGKRLRVYLTDTLNDAVRKTEILFKEFIAEEADQATEIKQNLPLMVVVGNPPYSVSSSNKGKLIEQLVTRYKKAVRSEKNIQPLSDDYIKFLCFAHHQIEKTGYGAICLITNHSYLNGLIHRGIREELINTFDQLFLLDLHGNSLLNETPPINYHPDQNVFDIQQGVSIASLIKTKEHKNCNTPKSIYHYNLWGSRESKYSFLSDKSINNTDWLEITPSHSNFFFSPQNNVFEIEYSSSFLLKNVFCQFSTGIETGKDACLVDFSEAELKPVIYDLYNSSIKLSGLKEKYKIEETSGWTVSKKRKDLLKTSFNESAIKKYCYRPFDNRTIYYSDFLRRPHRDIMQHLMQNNLALMVSRQQTEVGFHHIFLTNILGDCNALSLSSRERNYYFPLYVYSNTNLQKPALIEQRCSNLSPDFLKAIISKLGYTPTPESIFYYIYAIFHSPTYRTRYAEFLKIDFPRVPLTSCDRLFRQLATYGEELVALHLMKSPKLDNLITQFVEDSDRLVDAGHPKFSQGEVSINKKGDKFTGVPENVWNFHVGGYQVCQKWLKDRKGRTLSNEDIQHYQRIVVALKETIEIMENIDRAIPSFPIQ